MATFHSGVGGKITVTATDLHVGRWTITRKGTLAETTNSGTSGNETFKNVKTGWTWSCEVPWDSTNMPDVDASLDIGDEVTIIFTLGDSTKTYTGAAIVEQVEVVMDATGTDIIRCNVSGRGNGALTLPTT